MTIHRSTPLPSPTTSMVITPPRRKESNYDTTIHSLNSLAVLSLNNDRSTTKFRLLPRYNSIGSNFHRHQNPKRSLVHMISTNTDDSSIQSPTSHRKYMRRGSRTPSMLLLCHTALLEMAHNHTIDTTEMIVPTTTPSSASSITSTPVKNNEMYDHEVSYQDEQNPNVTTTFDDNTHQHSCISPSTMHLLPFSDDMLYRNAILPNPYSAIMKVSESSTAKLSPSQQHLPSIPLL